MVYYKDMISRQARVLKLEYYNVEKIHKMSVIAHMSIL